MAKEYKTVLGGVDAPEVLYRGALVYPCVDIGEDERGEKTKTPRTHNLEWEVVKHFYGQGFVVSTEADLSKMQKELGKKARIARYQPKKK